MSDRDPKLPHRGRPDGNRNNYQSNATKNQLTNGHIVGEVSYLPHSNESLVHKVNALATELESLHTNFEDLKTLYNTLYSSVEYLKKGAWNVTVGPFLDQEAAEFKKNLDLLTAEARSIGFGYDGANSNECQGLSPSVVSHPQLSNSNASTTERRFIPPHLRNSVGNGSNNSNTNDRLVNDSQVDKISTKLPMAAVAEPTPPSSPMTTVYRDNVPASVKPITNNITLDTKAWQPYYLTTLPSLESSITAHIPELHTMESFSPDFLGNELGGSEWSPGLTLILGWKPSCPLRTAHCYYTVDAVNDPFLPSTPGTHGAKLVPFFNDSIENEHPAPTGCYDSNENVPMFVLLPDARRNDSLRYFYFGNYSQTRWSDKLDYDRMVQCVPQHVREYWANELSVNGRPEWLTKEILNHFFPKPTYEGPLPGISEDDGGSVASEDMDECNKEVFEEIQNYQAELVLWHKKYNPQTTKLVSKEFIMEAFDRPDADDPAALRLQWEYLQCVDWNPDLYKLLVDLQNRSPTYNRYVDRE